MSTIVALLPSAATVRPASADPADVSLAACDAVACVADCGDGLPWSRRSHSYSGRTCCSSENLFC